MLYMSGQGHVLHAFAAAAVEAEDLTDLMADIGGLVEIYAEREVPVKTGRLQRSITSYGTANKAVISAGNPPGVVYAPIVQYGYPPDGTRKQEPNPFLTRALYEASGAVTDEFAKGINELLKKAKLK